ncbi:MAG: sulfate permease [Gammaproteobacteria bacterium]|nr:MAG: sulfate permease [Gammaproteobacteria bacterium]
MRGYLTNFFPFMGWIRNYRAPDVRLDMVAALTVAVVAVPQSMAYALIAGLPVQYGLYAAIVPCVVGSLWGSSAQLVTGPTNAISLVVFSSLTGIVDPYTDFYVQLAFTLALLTGVIQIALGMARLGVLVNFVSHSVVIGFTAGAGVLIAIKQLKNLFFDPSFAASLPKTDTIIGLLWQVIQNLHHLHPATLFLGLLSIGVIVLVRRSWPVHWGPAPGPLVAMIACGVVVALFSREIGSVDLGATSQWVAGGMFGSDGATMVVGEIPRTLPPLSMPIVNDWVLLRDLFSAALAISLLGLLEAVSIARAIASQTRQRLDGNQEFVGQGLSNVSAAFFSAYPGSGSFTRSAVNHRAGAVTPLSGVYGGIVVAVTVLLFANLAAYLPIAALAGMLLVVAYSMVDRHALKLSLTATKSDRAAVIVTFLATLFLHLEYAVFIGVGLSIVLYLARISRPEVRRWSPPESMTGREAPTQPCPQLPVIQVDGSIFFGSTSFVKDSLLRILRAHPQASHLAIRMGAVNHLDASGVHGLEEIVDELQQRGGNLLLLEPKLEILHVLDNAGLLETIGANNIIHQRTRDAIVKILPQLDDEICNTCSTIAFGNVCEIHRNALAKKSEEQGASS